MPSGTMYMSDARFSATWCPPIAAAPNQPANTEIEPNVVNSTLIWMPIGRPMRSVRISASPRSASRRSGISTPASSRRPRTSSIASMSQRPIVLESAAPGAPIAGAPRWPNTSTQSSPRLTRLPATIVITTARVCFSACRA